MKKIGVFNNKGGVSKTTSTVNIAGCLYKEHGMKVLIVDCDGSRNATKYLTAATQVVPELTLADCLNGTCSAKEAILPAYIKERKKWVQLEIDFLPSSAILDNEDYKLEIQLNNPKESIRNLLLPLEDEYDYCLFDCAPAQNVITTRALVACDYVIVPVFPDDDSIDGYGILLDIINNLKITRLNETIQILGVFLARVSGNHGFDSYMKSILQSGLGNKFFATMVRTSTAAVQARHYGLPLCYFKQQRKERGTTAEDYSRLTYEIVNRIKIQSRKVGI